MKLIFALCLALLTCSVSAEVFPDGPKPMQVSFVVRAARVTPRTAALKVRHTSPSSPSWVDGQMAAHSKLVKVFTTFDIDFMSFGDMLTAKHSK